MSQRQKFLAQLMAAGNSANLHFDALVNLLLFLGFEQRIRGSHHIFTKDGVSEISNLQPAAGNMVKPYQAKQVRELLVRYNLTVFIDKSTPDAHV
ncbi:type II toxin-antitoxin system HicA family toxin [Hymenobacter sp. ASUV-10]|uniref:Type II toxin-antitoxin system HicA family toxin n=1 Tax=Hymenobacter aranciens TaxID=3063996 RepID=A0ABT9BCH1_9BACT|nr:type II toxin-antitoxin system HicA family toxin [Hymenobacter sp. ASUV-10]MDO7875961.1 type II toxin-antitoxin system HicA family toxin [Hymenobacter sp. ASUV-10]